MTRQPDGPRTYGWAQRHDAVRELLGQLATDAALAGTWPELDDLAQFGTRRLLDAYDHATNRRDSRRRGYGATVADLEKALWAATHDARVLGNPRPLDLLTRARIREGTPDW